MLCSLIQSHVKPIGKSVLHLPNRINSRLIQPQQQQQQLIMMFSSFPGIQAGKLKVPKSFKVKQTKRLGRGIGSGKGKQSGRGKKGMKARTGNHGLNKFEGSVVGFWKRASKFGFSNRRFSRRLNSLNLDKLQRYIDNEKISPNHVITMRELYSCGALGTHVKHGVKLLGVGEINQPIIIEVTRASKSAIEKIEEKGGSVVCAYYNPLGLRALIKPENFERKNIQIPLRAKPKPKDIDYYLDWENRGYLSQVVQLLPVIDKDYVDLRGLQRVGDSADQKIVKFIDPKKVKDKLFHIL